MYSTMSLSHASEKNPYENSIIKASLHQFPLDPQPLIYLDEKKTTFAALVDEQHYKLSDKFSKEFFWVVTQSQLKSLCNTHKNKTVANSMAQMLGIPLDSEHKRRIIVFSTETIQAYYGQNPSNIGIFRPCTDPRIHRHADQTDTCPLLMDEKNQFISSDYKTWFINNAIATYTLNTNQKTHSFLGFPWTQLGYTYNWNPAAKHFYGLSEFVVTPNTPIEILANPLHHKTAYLTPTEFCHLP
jgi:hypothetical protein